MNKSSNITSRVVELTPDYAAELLARNPRNRKISRVNYGTVRRAIENGEWVLNGEAIKVAADGNILDGQHRCQAVIDTGITIKTFLIEGLPSDTQVTMDTGKSRALKDALQINGEPNSVGLAAVIRKCIVSERFGIQAATSNINHPITIKECLAWLDCNPWVRGYVIPGADIGRKVGLPGSLASLLMITFDAIDSEDSAFFWARLADGVGLQEGSPILALAKMLQSLKLEVRGQRSQRYLAALVIKAWNKYRDGEPIHQLKFRTGGANPESYPEPR